MVVHLHNRFLALVGALAVVVASGALWAEPTAEGELEQVCDEGRPDECVEVGERAERLGTPEGLSRARQAYFLGCRGDHLRSCVRLAIMLEEGVAGPRDEALAGRLQQYTCDSGDRLGCYRLSLMLRDGRGIERDVERARELLLDACGQGNDDACEALDELVMTRADVDRTAVSESASAGTSTDGGEEQSPEPSDEEQSPEPSDEEQSPEQPPEVEVENEGLSMELIGRRVRQQSGEIRACFAQVGRSAPRASGWVEIVFVIHPTGSVMNAMPARSTLGDRDVGHCIARAVSRASFPPPRNRLPMVIRMPFSYHEAMSNRRFRRPVVR